MTTPPRLQRLAAANRRYELIAEAAAAGFGPDTKGAARKAKAEELRSAGSAVADIAALFGVSSERIRMILGLGQYARKCQAADGN